MTQLSNNLLDKTEQLFHNVRASMIEAAAALYEVHKTEAWKERHENFGEYVQTLGISHSQASKYITVVEHYIQQGGLSHAKIAGVEMEKLYLAKNLEGNPEEQVEKALVLSRSDIRAQKAFEETGEEHQHQPICRICHIKLS